VEAASTGTAGAPRAGASAAVEEPFREPFVGHPEPAGQAELIGLPKDEIDTPALLLDLDRFERNASRISDFLRARGVDWRPHSKAHKSPAIARRQMQLGAIGVTCAKVSEAEVMVDHGIPSILVANEQGRRQKFDKLAALNRRAEVITCADSPAHVGMASAAGLAAGVEIPMLVDLNVGMERTGVAPGEPARDLARLIEKTPGVKFLGLMGYEGHLLTIWPLEEKERLAREQMGWMVETRRLIEADGLPVRIVSGGGSGTYMVSGLIEGITEIQAGGACFMDRFYGEECHMEDDFEYALSVVTTVTSRPIPQRGIIDGGFKTMSDGESGRPRVLGHPGIALEYLSAEHGNLALAPEAQGLAIGDRLEWIPGYSDTTTFLHNTFVGIRDGRVAAVIPLVGRGKLT
jgi:D-serine deaminase-like pyridoxal phosphate-dependent protein